MKFLIHDSTDLQYFVRAIKAINRSLKKLKASLGSSREKNIRLAIENLESTPIEIIINHRFEKTYGTANISWYSDTESVIDEYHLEFSPSCFKTRRLLFEIVSHEVSHLLEFKIVGNSNHGRLWKRIHQMMGGTGSRCIDESEFI